MQYPNFLQYRSYRYLKLAGMLVVIAVLAYLAARPSSGASYGGTWFGYVLGVASALLIILLTWYGVRRRRTPRVANRRLADRRRMMTATVATEAERRGGRRRTLNTDESWRHGGTLQGWLSAHVYLGTALLVLVSLHSGFRFGWNVHTLAYMLLLTVLASGIYGVFAYLRYPRLITRNIGGDTLNSLLVGISDLDEMARIRALGLPDKVNDLVSRARRETRIGGSFLQQLRGTPRDCPAELALKEMQVLAQELVKDDQPRLMRDLHVVLVQKQQLVRKARNDIRINALMRSWLYLHVPLTVALLAAIVAHVLAIGVYW